mmetsp:Transcript_10657/g.28167  ORF Transcript_10657/g.28167 Transcript_10657/m.28167 type:complete len:237 (-) Transcript_10657:480-1190(-)
MGIATTRPLYRTLWRSLQDSRRRCTLSSRSCRPVIILWLPQNSTAGPTRSSSTPSRTSASKRGSSTRRTPTKPRRSSTRTRSASTWRRSRILPLPFLILKNMWRLPRPTRFPSSATTRLGRAAGPASLWPGVLILWWNLPRSGSAATARRSAASLWTVLLLIGASRRPTARSNILWLRDRRSRTTAATSPITPSSASTPATSSSSYSRASRRSETWVAASRPSTPSSSSRGWRRCR